MTFSDDLDHQRTHAMRAARHAGDSWAQAMRAHKLAPPDADFATRRRDLAHAAASERDAWENAHAAGLAWRPVPGAEDAEPPYELRRGTGRRGPDEAWARFDAAVASLNEAIARTSAAEVADAFGVLADAAQELADAVAAEDETAARPRTRGAA
jgi:hypothetical protein